MRGRLEAYIGGIGATFINRFGTLDSDVRISQVRTMLRGDRRGSIAMTIIKIRERAQITLPAEMRKALKVETGDYLRAEVVEGALMLKPIALLDREAARARVKEAMDTVRYIGPRPEPSDDEVMRMVVEEIEDMRRAKREDRSR
ncbi:MAG: AbrB/MazE/SpoVT family DNA-binding domain-containing protein [Geminicoccaceae bacterium]